MDPNALEVECALAHGSFGVVFQAECNETGDIVAIKKVLQDKRFKNRELAIMRALAPDHPNVVQLRHCFYSCLRLRLCLCSSDGGS